MRKKRLPMFSFCFHLAAFLVICPGLGAAGDELTVSFPSGSYEIKDTGSGQEIYMDNFGRHLVPGTPKLPAKIFSVAVPPGAVINDVTFEAEGSVVLPGRYNIVSVGLPRAVGEENPESYARDRKAHDEKFETIYGSDSVFPPAVGEFVRHSGYRKYKMADVRLSPFSYHPVSGKLIYHPRINVTVHYNLSERAPGDVMTDNLIRKEKLARKMIANYDQAQAWYPKARASRGLYDYVIITLDSLTASVQPLVDWEILKGRTVNVVTTTWINTNYTGYDLAEKMRNFLREKYPSGQWGIEDVCLVGHYDDVPMRRCEQDLGYGKPETDYYYAELSLPDSQSWDADVDRRWGEDSDPIDFTAEVNVGRIPWSDPATVLSICNKSVAYENNGDPSFKKNILLLGAYFWPDTDNAVLMEYKTNPSHYPWMAGWTSTKMYEQGHSSYAMDYNLSNSNVRTHWSQGQYGFVNYAGHGSPTSCHIYYSKGSAFIQSSDCSILNDDYPAIIFADACSNSDTDYTNIGQEMLRQGGVGFLGSTKVAYGMPGWNDPYDGSSQSMDCFFTTCCTSGDYTQGEAHQWALREMYTSGLWYSIRFEMFEWGALWGNPDLSMGTAPDLTLTFPDGLPEGRQPPGPSHTLTVEIRDGLQNYVPGSGKLHYRYDPAGTFTEVALTPLGGGLFEATLPSVVPGDEPEFYFEAQGDGGAMVYSPFNAPSQTYSFDVCLSVEIMHDNFETDIGWTVEDVNVSTGTWERCDPNPTSGSQVAPVDDNPAGTGTMCYVTGNGPSGATYSDWDIDGGPTRLISPTLDFSSGDANVSCYYWFYGRDGDDPFMIDVSNNNGTSWTNVFTTYTSNNSWEYYTFAVGDYVTPTAQVKVRFSAQDQPNNSITEAGVDDFMIEQILYDPSFWAEAYTIAASQGCTIDLSLDAGAAYANRDYTVMAGMSGHLPGYTMPGGVVLPVNWDGFSNLVLGNLNGAHFVNWRGLLDGQGEATATLASNGPVPAQYVGQTMTIAFGMHTQFDYASNPIFIEITP